MCLGVVCVGTERTVGFLFICLFVCCCLLIIIICGQCFVFVFDIPSWLRHHHRRQLDILEDRRGLILLIMGQDVMLDLLSTTPWPMEPCPLSLLKGTW